MRAADARITAAVLVTTDTWGIFTHGTKALLFYLRKIRAGGIKRDANPKIVTEGESWALLDGDAGMAMVTSCAAMELAIRKAKSGATGYVGVRNSCHFGAAGYYAWLAAQQDMIGLAMSNSDPNMSVPGGRWKIMGNNPIAYCVPAGHEQPVLFDIALSAVAAGKVAAAADKGEKVPEGWLTDTDGLPTTNAALYPAKACLTPMAGHKGYGFALLVEVLAAAITGACLTKQVKSWIIDQPDTPTGHGHAFIAVNPAVFMPLDEFKTRIDNLIREIRGSPKASGSSGVRVPGEFEWERREDALANGIPLPTDVMASLRLTAKECNITEPDWLKE